MQAVNLIKQWVDDQGWWGNSLMCHDSTLHKCGSWGFSKHWPWVKVYFKVMGEVKIIVYNNDDVGIASENWDNIRSLTLDGRWHRTGISDPEFFQKLETYFKDCR